MLQVKAISLTTLLALTMVAKNMVIHVTEKNIHGVRLPFADLVRWNGLIRRYQNKNL